MKLLLCRKCNDIFNLALDMKTCSCGNAKGRYIDKLNAEYSGENVVPLGFDNASVCQALIKQPNQGEGSRFTAFVIPKKCLTMRKKG